MDSGAEESVAPPNLFPGVVSPSPMSRSGRRYRAANGTRILNLGQQNVQFLSGEGHRCGLPFQVAEVERLFISVAKLAAAGNRVELGKNSGKIVNDKTGRTIALQRSGGVYVLRMNVSAAPSDFPRQGR